MWVPIWKLHPLISRSKERVLSLRQGWEGRSLGRGILRSWESLSREASTLSDAPFKPFLTLQCLKATFGHREAWSQAQPILPGPAYALLYPSHHFLHPPHTPPPDLPPLPSFTELLSTYKTCKSKPTFLCSLAPPYPTLPLIPTQPHQHLTIISQLLPESSLNSARRPGLDSTCGSWFGVSHPWRPANTEVNVSKNNQVL